MYEQKIKNFQYLYVLYKIWKKWGDDIINSLICIFISTFQEMFREKLQIFTISDLPYSQILIQF